MERGRKGKVVLSNARNVLKINCLLRSVDYHGNIARYGASLLHQNGGHFFQVTSLLIALDTEHYTPWSL